MRKFGMKPGQVYSAEQVRTIRDEIGGRDFPLKGEINFNMFGAQALLDDDDARTEHSRHEAKYHPSNYPVSEFVKCCRDVRWPAEKKPFDLCLYPVMLVVMVRPVFPIWFRCWRIFN